MAGDGYYSAIKIEDVINAGGELIKNFQRGFIYNETSYKAGLYLLTCDETNEQLIICWLCDSLEVVAKTITQEGESGKLLQFTRGDTGEDEGVIISSGDLIVSFNNPVLKVLATRGLRASRDGKRQKAIIDYIVRAEPKELRRYTNKTGWNNNNSLFIFPDETIGGDGLYFHNSGNNQYKTSGTLEAWRETIGAVSAGNPIIQLVIMGAFAGSLLKFSNLDGGGLHLYGNSSKGKSTALKVASSVWGDYHEYIHSWNTTANGIEEYSKCHNDTMLALDELQNANAKTAGAIVYNILNGTPKMRASVRNNAVSVANAERWRIFAISTGENDISGFLAESKGQAIKAGQTVRLIDINIDSRQYGAFDDTKDYPPDKFAMLLEDYASSNYGTAGRGFISYLIHHKPDIKNLHSQAIDTLQLDGLSTEERRAGKLLALLQVAGELAISAKLVNWQAHEPRQAVTEAFKSWQRNRGASGLSLIDNQILAGYKRYTAENLHALVNNSIKHQHVEPPKIAIKGWYIDDSEGRRQYLFTPSQFQSIAPHARLATIAKAFKAIGALVHDDNKLTSKRSLAHYTPTNAQRERVYIVRDNVVTDFIDNRLET